MQHFKTCAEFIRPRMTAQWVDGDGKILLSDNTGSRAVALRPIGFQCIGVWTSDELHFMFDHTYTRFLLALDMLERKCWVYRGLCLYVRLWPIIRINEPNCKANRNEVKSSGMSRCAGITVSEVSKDHNVFFSQVLQKQYLWCMCVSVHHIWKWREVPTWCNYLFIIINNSTCRIQTYTQCTRLQTGSSGPQPHIVLNTICSSIQRIQPNNPEDGHIDARNM